MNRKIKKLLFRFDFKSVFFALFGAFIIALGTYVYSDSDIPKGGIIGICFILENMAGVPIVISNLVINALCYLFAWRLMGTKYILNAGFATLSFTAFYSVLTFFSPDISFLDGYSLLAALLGAALMELGTGISIRFGSAPDGEHALAVSIEDVGHIDTAWIHFTVDFSVILISILYVKNLYLIVFALIIAAITIPIQEIASGSQRGEDDATTKKKLTSFACVSLAVILIVSGACLYVNDYYRADTEAIEQYRLTSKVEERELSDGIIAYVPAGDIKAGLVFYPGAKVEYTSYEPLLRACAEKGILAITVRMPLNIAILGSDLGVDVPSYFPEVESWYIGGHSLGGSMAAACASKHSDIFEGVILLASYSTADISNTRVLSVYGTMDEVLNKGNYEKNKKNLPSNFTERLINGGNHAYFGTYGEQKGDGDALISNKEQIDKTAAFIAEFVAGK